MMMDDIQERWYGPYNYPYVGMYGFEITIKKL